MKNNTSEHLKRAIGVTGLSSNIVNIIIGAGIFALPAIVAAGLGSAGIFAYIFCGILITLIMLCFAEVGSKITSSGGVYAYIQTSFGPCIGFLTAILFISSAATADAAVANAMTSIIGKAFPVLNNPFIRILFLMILFGGLGYLNIKGIREGITLVKVITLIKLIPLIILIFFSWEHVSPKNLKIDTYPELKEIGQVSLILFFAFQGAESGLSVSGEVKQPRKNIPKAILIAIITVLILYILIQTIAQGVLGQKLPEFTENPLSVVAGEIFGPVGYSIMTIAAVISMFGNLSSEILSMPRILFRASKDRVLPIFSLSRVHPKFSTPYYAIITYSCIGFLIAVFGGFKQLAVISSAAMLLVYLGVSLSVIKLRRNFNTHPEAFKLPGGMIIPLISVIIILWLLSNLSTIEITGISIFITILTLVYFANKKIKWRLGKKESEG